MSKKLGLLLLALGVVGLVFAGAITNPAPSGGLGNAVWVEWDGGNYGSDSYLRVDSTESRDTSYTIYSRYFYEADSCKLYIYTAGALVGDDDSIFVCEQHQVDPWGNWSTIDTIIKAGDADAAGIDTVIASDFKWQWGIRFITISIGTAKKPDTVQIVVTEAN